VKNEGRKSTGALSDVNASVQGAAIPAENLIGRSFALPPTMNIRIKSDRKWETVELPIPIDEFTRARVDYEAWVADKPTGPLDGSWGSLMDWWMNDRRPEWKRFDAIDRCYLKYAVGLPLERIVIRYHLPPGRLW
jgi:hypothetical protein